MQNHRQQWYFIKRICRSIGYPMTYQIKIKNYPTMGALFKGTVDSKSYNDINKAYFYANDYDQIKNKPEYIYYVEEVIEGINT